MNDSYSMNDSVKIHEKNITEMPSLFEKSTDSLQNPYLKNDEEKSQIGALPTERTDPSYSVPASNPAPFLFSIALHLPTDPSSSTSSLVSSPALPLSFFRIMYRRLRMLIF